MTVVVYGVSSNADSFLFSEFNNKDEDKLFVTTQGGGEYIGHKVMSLSELSERGYEDIREVIITSQFVSEIMQSLLAIGVSQEIIKFYDHSLNRLRNTKDMVLEAVDEDSLLYAIYDLRTNLPVYDFLNFCVNADVERQKKNLSKIHFIIVPDVSKYDDSIGIAVFHDKSDYEWRIHNIIYGVCKCVPAMTGITKLSYREQISEYNIANSYPEDYELGRNINVVGTLPFSQLRNEYELSYIKPPEQAVGYVDSFIEENCSGKKIVVVTLREYSIHEDRNTDLESWAAFIRSLDRDEYCPVLVRDTYFCMNKFGGDLDEELVFPLASFDFTIRAALYSKAYLNMSVATGPSFSFNYIKGCRSITFQQVDDRNPATSKSLYEKTGVLIGKDLPFRDNVNQLICWEKITPAILNKYFNKAVHLIEG